MEPRDVFLALLHGVCDQRYDDLPALYAEHTDVSHPFDPDRAPALTTRAELAAHFGRARGYVAPKVKFEPVDIVVHETADPEVIVGEFTYAGTVLATGEPMRVPGIFVLRVRDGEIVESRDYVDHAAMRRALAA
ncbi:nuclear transport factor 2 family protein [Hamadaea tsunoensis]|uniref:nuclear transport factor 2 family protein n=1 Tax=Hamadaea tsunoensis TaxID=53368 RepID=UPI000404130F|nr:nuclear transport factor 2 family protein [Hamadaea tsunoensis]